VKDYHKLAIDDGRYSPYAFQFLFEGLDHAVKLHKRHQREGAARHVSGQELIEGMKAYARELFGPLAAYVWRTWGIRETIDWGNIVFLLVDAELLTRQDGDTLDDFRSGFDFDREFVETYEPKLPPELPRSPLDEG